MYSNGFFMFPLLIKIVPSICATFNNIKVCLLKGHMMFNILVSMEVYFSPSRTISMMLNDGEQALLSTKWILQRISLFFTKP